MLKYTDKIYLNYEILRTEIWNMSPEIFLKVEIWGLIFLSLKVHRRFLLVVYPSEGKHCGHSMLFERRLLSFKILQHRFNKVFICEIMATNTSIGIFDRWINQSQFVKPLSEMRVLEFMNNHTCFNKAGSFNGKRWKLVPLGVQRWSLLQSTVIQKTGILLETSLAQQTFCRK